LSRDIFYNFNLNNAVSLQNAEYRHFVKSTPASLAFALATKVGLIKLNLTGK
jgi:hypothetical protein